MQLILGDPGLAEANGNPLRITHSVALMLLLGNKRVRIAFYVAPRLTVTVIAGTGFMNVLFDDIRCRDPEIEVHKGGTIAIVAVHTNPETASDATVLEKRTVSLTSADMVPHEVLKCSVSLLGQRQNSSSSYRMGGG